MNTVRVANFEIGAGNPLALLAGPCVLEDLDRLGGSTAPA